MPPIDCAIHSCRRRKKPAIKAKKVVAKKVGGTLLVAKKVGSTLLVKYWNPAVVAGLTLLLLAIPDQGHAQRRVGEAIPNNWQDDAELNAIHFIDAQNAWAVGEHGTLLRSRDSGRSWQPTFTTLSLSSEQGKITPEMQRLLDSVRKNTGSDGMSSRQTIRQSLDVRLESVSFSDKDTGVAVGGYFSPGTNISRGLVLTTRDGGETWEPTSGAVIPKLNQVVLEKGVHGWAVGNHSNLLGTGIATTSDAGRSWYSDPAGLTGSWRRACRTSNQGWLLLNENGHMYVADGNRLEPSILLNSPSARIYSILLADGNFGWAVGDQGTFLVTRDGGRSWRPAVGELDQVRLRAFDLRTVCLHGNRLFIAGNPGTFIFSFDIETQQLTETRIPNRARLNALNMADDQTGSAVGAQGTILTTHDGGLSWQLVRGGNSSVAVLAVHFADHELPLEGLAKTCLADGYRAAVARITWKQDSVAPERLTQAASRLGIGETRIIDTQLNQKRFDQAQRMVLLGRLVATLREFEPRLVVTNAATVIASDGTSIDVYQLLDEAIKMAANPQAFPENISATGLSHWQVDRLAVLSEFGDGQWRVDRNAILNRTGRRLDDEIALSRGLIGQPLISSGLATYRVQSYGNRPIEIQNDIWQGIGHTQHKIPRRLDARLGSRNLRDMGYSLDKTKSLERIGQLPLITVGDKILWEQNLQTWLNEVDRETAGLWLAQLAEFYYAKGDLRGASIAMDYFLSYYPDHVLSPLVMATFLSYIASREAHVVAVVDSKSRRSLKEIADEASHPRQEIQVNSTSIGTISTTVWTPNPEPQAPVRIDTTTGSATVSSAAEKTVQTVSFTEVESQLWKNAAQQFLRIRQRDPELVSHPSIRALEAHVIRNGESWPHAAGLFRQLAGNPMADNNISAWAAQEIRLQQTTVLPQEPLVLCPKISARPYLDGDLNDPTWTETDNLLLHSATTGPFVAPLEGADRVRLAYDEEFLFLAIQCQKLDGVVYVEPTKGRSRNPVLEMFDRVEIAFDTDRDQNWPLRLVIDSRGWVADHLGGSTAWNPMCYVAAKQTPTHWTIEAAIPWSELGGSPKNGTFWGLGLARLPPRRRDNYWPTPTPTLQRNLLALPSFTPDTYRVLTFRQIAD
jgi:photosystem II stability/assembly factor-like uncharacterized protein